MIEDPEWREKAYKDMSMTSEINIPSQDLLFQREGNVWRSQEKRTSTKICPQPRKIKLSSQDLLFSGEGNIWWSHEKRTSTQSVPLTRKIELPSQRSRLSSQKLTPQDGHRIRWLSICSFGKYIRDCTQILWSSIQIPFVHIFCDYKFWHARWDLSTTSHVFLQKSRLPSPNNIFFKGAIATQNVASQASRKNNRSLSQRSCQAGITPNRRVHVIVSRSRGRATVAVVVSLATKPSPKHQDLLQKVSR